MFVVTSVTILTITPLVFYKFGKIDYFSCIQHAILRQFYGVSAVYWKHDTSLR